MTEALTSGEPETGRTVLGRYRLERPLMKGGMGSVWVATHMTLGHEIALKFIHVEGEARADALRRFEREAQLIARLKSPYVVQVLDYGVDETNRPYLAMELLTGQSLKARLDRGRSISIEEMTRVVVQVCRALHRAHAAGVVHRDIKPANIFLCDDDDRRVKVLDFGIAKTSSLASTDQQNTATGMIVGTPGSMSPEQALGRPEIDGRSDLFSLGVVAWRCLTGRHPHEREGTPASFGELIVAVATQSIPLPSTILGDIPCALDLWFARALATMPDDRFSSAKEMAEALMDALGMPSVPFATGELTAAGSDDANPSSGARLGPLSPVHMRHGELRAGAPSADQSTMLNTVTVLHPPDASRRPKKRSAFILACAVAVVGVLGVVLVSRSSRTTIPKESVAAHPPPISSPESTAAQDRPEPPAATPIAPGRDASVTEDVGPRGREAAPPQRRAATASTAGSGAAERKDAPKAPPPTGPSPSETPAGARGRLLDDRL